MLSTVRSRALWRLSQRAQAPVKRSFASTTTLQDEQKQTGEAAVTVKTPTLESLQETTGTAVEVTVLQAPNRTDVWSRSQQPRSKAMVGPRFEQTVMEDQPQPHAAIELIHKQPVRWIHERTVVCDGGGGPLGHPRVFINLDKPQICMCEYCGLPFANEHHRAHLESLPSTTYPLETQGHIAEVSESQRITDEPLAQR